MNLTSLMSQDIVVNDFGMSLIELCKKLDIHLLNGRAPGDKLGHYTNITELGCCIVDYIIVDTTLYEHVDSLQVLPVPTTNHMPILCTLNIYLHARQ